MSLKTGDLAPNFNLFSSDKKEVSLTQYNGRKNLLIVFFPLAFTSICTKEMCDIRDSFTDYRNLKGDVVAISIDTIFSLEKFRNEHHLPFLLLSDFNKEASKAYNVLQPEFAFGMQGVSKSAAFVVSKNGTIQYAEVLESAGDLPNFEAIKSVLNALE